MTPEEEAKRGHLLCSVGFGIVVLTIIWFAFIGLGWSWHDALIFSSLPALLSYYFFDLYRKIPSKNISMDKNNFKELRVGKNIRNKKTNKTKVDDISELLKAGAGLILLFVVVAGIFILGGIFFFYIVIDTENFSSTEIDWENITIMYSIIPMGLLVILDIIYRWIIDKYYTKDEIYGDKYEGTSKLPPLFVKLINFFGFILLGIFICFISVSVYFGHEELILPFIN